VLDRRSFTLGLTSTAFAGLALASCRGGALTAPELAAPGYGPLLPDPARLLDLPRGFTYRIISRHGDRMDDGYPVPDRADGMGAFGLDGRHVALVRNHELARNHGATGAFAGGVQPGTKAFDSEGGRPLPGGTSTLVYDLRTGRVESQYLSLAGTIRNCAGGVTPWGSWLSCEEPALRAPTGLEPGHGWVFEVPARHRGTVDPLPLRALGQFNHEAAAVDPRTGIVYLTEDRENGLFYRFLPDTRGALARGGRLQALAWADRDRPADSRNWERADLAQLAWHQVRWVDIGSPESPGDELRDRGHARGAVLFARGEGIWFGDGELYFCCTNGGRAKLSQIMRYRPSRFEGQPREEADGGRLQLFVESTSPEMLNYGDNLTVAPNGHLIVCEDQYTDPARNYLRGVTPRGTVYPFAFLHENTELAGACFSPDGRVMFVNVYSPGRTLAITGPWSAAGG
jgi:secreted PhoX family phosphatase